MTRLRVTPERRHGRDRLYVTRPDGTGVAWYDQDAGRVSLLFRAARDDVLAALAPYLTGEVTIGPPPVPSATAIARLSLAPDDDLAPNRPGEALHAALDALPGPRAPARRLSFRPDPRPGELHAQQDVGEWLDRLEGAGWRTLHCVPLPGAAPTARIDHLAIGPAGVLAVHTLAARKQRVRVTDPLVRTGRAAAQPHLRWARRAAERASLALATAVQPVLAVAGASRLEARPAPLDVRILHDTEIPALAALEAVLEPAEIETLYATARDRHTWLRA